eukprot:CAMPEP_0177634674 /NCGR_PEP_ID=MMETSP0447-20121125/3493_1 /TAXON_ID=0 /ORGANISM="Stygamoeba regulata, Strain BSH-02190019" /LENGTH=495 /DNA_ID=CAMNT_0019136409 /DNA_START=47 /DNA_END=1534 /DNA_ORIENTATION=+
MSTSGSSSAAPRKLSNFIGGKFVPPSNGRYLDSFNPATGEVCTLVPSSDASDAKLAVHCASEAFQGWSRTEPAARAALLRRVADLLESRLQEFAVAESQDQGKPVSLALAVDIPRAVYNFRFFAGAILHHEEHSTVLGPEMLPRAVNYTTRTPVGVAGLISPWNLPIYLLTWKIAPCIATGNTCVCKPSEMTSVTAYMLCEVLNEAGVPPGVVNMVFGLGPEVGQALVDHEDVPLISFTGGTVTGSRIMASCAPLCKKLSLELGGKNPNIIFDDADLDLAVATTVRSSFANQGEICLCGSRIFVQEGVYDRFLERFVQEAGKLVVGDPSDLKTTTGALISKEHREKVESYIEIARQDGAKVALGGDRPILQAPFDKGYFVNPTILTDVPSTCRAQTEEIFGPVVTVTKFREEVEVIEYANSVKYGLSATVWTENVKRAHRVAHQIRSGTVWVNCWLQRDLRMPFGGMKQSGLGREGGSYSIEFFTDHKTVCMSCL